MKRLVFIAIAAAANVAAQPIYRCGSSYSDEPCPGAAEVAITPTEGAHSMSGTKRGSTELEMKKLYRAVDKGMQPLTGLTDEQAAKNRRRYKLSPQARDECAKLDKQIGKAGADEQKTYEVRKQYWALRC